MIQLDAYDREAILATAARAHELAIEALDWWYGHNDDRARWEREALRACRWCVDMSARTGADGARVLRALDALLERAEIATACAPDREPVTPARLHAHDRIVTARRVWASIREARVAGKRVA
jgi:hypothetical protein